MNRNRTAIAPAAPLELLRRDCIANIALLQLLERKSYSRLKTEGDSLRLKDRLSGAYFFSIVDSRDIDSLLFDIEDDLNVFFVNSIRFLEEFRQRFPTAGFETYSEFVMLPGFLKPQCPLPEGFTFTAPDMEWLDFILYNYHNPEFNSVQYITDRLVHAPSLGIVKGKEKAAFVLLHKNGETGPIIVADKFRRQGLGSALLSEFNQTLLPKYHASYTLVSSSNVASALTMLSCGYQKADTDIFWGYRILK